MPNRKERRAAEAEGEMSARRFMEVADKFIDLANRQNQTVPATELHAIFLYASARYSAHVAKNVLEAENQEEFVEAMLRTYGEMLRNHLADPEL